MLLQDGMRNAFRPLSQAASHARSIHIPSSAVGKKLPLPPGGVSSGKAKGVFDGARNALTRLLYGTQPISTSINPQAFRRAIHTHTAQPFRNQFSFPVRHALSNSPLSFARPPAVQRGMTEVGLGTARKFSTARPIFQHLVQNVPVAGRSMYEMDLDLEKKKGRRLGSKRTKQGQALGAREKTKVKRSTFEENLDKYFAVFPTTGEEVSATLVVPLSPPKPLSSIANLRHQRAQASSLSMRCGRLSRHMASIVSAFQPFSANSIRRKSGIAALITKHLALHLSRRMARQVNLRNAPASKSSSTDGPLKWLGML